MYFIQRYAYIKKVYGVKHRILFIDACVATELFLNVLSAKMVNTRLNLVLIYK